VIKSQLMAKFSSGLKQSIGVSALVFFQDYFQFPNDPVAFLEWFAATVVIVILVTLLYHYVLGRSPPPEGGKVIRTENSNETFQVSTNGFALIQRADSALKSNDLSEAIEYSAEAVSTCLADLVKRKMGQAYPGMGASDLAYLVQAKAKSAPQLAEAVNQINNLRLKVAQNQPIDFQQASWAVSFAIWLNQIVIGDLIKF
jgi:hypothetical protein